jgi:hypothetical protein
MRAMLALRGNAAILVAIAPKTARDNFKVYICEVFISESPIIFVKVSEQSDLKVQVRAS